MSEDLDKFLDQLKDDTTLTSTISSSAKKVSDENVNEYVLEKSTTLIEAGLESINAVKNAILQGVDAESLEAYASLIKSVNDSIDTINKLNIQIKREKSATNLKKMDIEARKQIGPSQHNTTNNVLVATREEIIKMITDAKDKKEDRIIDTTALVVSEDNPQDNQQ